MKCLSEPHDKSEISFSDEELTEEQFLEKFAALEENLALLQIQMRNMSENVRLFGSLARRMRRSICPASSSPRQDMRPELSC